MTDSTTNTRSADSGFDVGSSVDDLFGEIASDSESDGDRWTGTDDGDESDAVEDQTAADVFDQLRTNAGDESGADDILADESPDDIIASADEPDPEPDAAVDPELLADDDELADLLLTGRSKETDGEFLWIDPDTDDAGTSESNADNAGTDNTDTSNEDPLEASEDTTPARKSEDVTDVDLVEQPDADDSVTDDTDADGGEPPSPNDTGAETESATPSTTESSADDGLELISDSSDDTETDEIDEADPNVDVDGTQSDDVGSDLGGDDTTAESATDGNTEEESDRTDDGSSGPLSKVRATLGRLF